MGRPPKSLKQVRKKKRRNRISRVNNKTSIFIQITTEASEAAWPVVGAAEGQPLKATSEILESKVKEEVTENSIKT